MNHSIYHWVLAREIIVFCGLIGRATARPSLEAITGDVLRVEAVCNEVGRKEATFVIP